MENLATGNMDNKTKYQCPGCSNNFWGRRNELLVCFACFEVLEQQEKMPGEHAPLKPHEKEQVAKKIIAVLRKEKNRLVLIEGISKEAC